MLIIRDFLFKACRSYRYSDSAGNPFHRFSLSFDLAGKMCHLLEIVIQQSHMVKFYVRQLFLQGIAEKRVEPADIPATNIVSKAWASVILPIHPAMAVTALELACQNLIILPDCRDAYYMAGDSPAKSFIKIPGIREP